jgi:hypothetical protein
VSWSVWESVPLGGSRRVVRFDAVCETEGRNWGSENIVSNFAKMNSIRAALIGASGIMSYP